MIQEERMHGPLIHDIKKLKLPEIKKYELSNGIPVYEYNAGVQDVFKLELSFRSGRPYEAQKMAAKCCAIMIREGTEHRTAAEIAEYVDYYGASLKITSNLDHIKIIVFSMSIYVEEILVLLHDLLNAAIFPEEEFNLYKSKFEQNLKVDLTKNDFLAYRKITEALYGEDHPYGYNSTTSHLSPLTTDDLKAHYDQLVVPARCTAFLSGRIQDKVRKSVDKYLGSWVKAEEKAVLNMPSGIPERGSYHFNSAQEHQTAIRYGNRLFGRLHEDHPLASLTSTILGGFFGSRLMQNLREDKGYTYNIYATLDTLVHDGYFYISTEVGNEVVEDSIKQIKKELHNLIEIPIPLDELKVVKNYLMGNYLGLLDGPFNVSRLMNTLITQGATLHDFERHVALILDATPIQIQQIAEKYFSPDLLTEVIVGEKQK